MKKIISLFKRDYRGSRQVCDEVTPGAEWVQNGDGIATQKMDGTCCMVRDGKLYKRYTHRNIKSAPENFEPATERNPITGKMDGWVPVGGGPEDKWHREAFDPTLPDGTYELCGPKVQGNPEECSSHPLFYHGGVIIDEVPTEFNELVNWFWCWHIEGIVWHHPDGRMVKIKKKDFGMMR